jgi:GTP-binding protein Era
MPRSGFVAIAGKPNAGKSTLLNKLVGQKLAITSAKVQSTRARTLGLRTDGDTQMVLVDAPGLLDPEYPLQHAMRRTALRAIADADVIVYLADAQHGTPPPLEHAAGLQAPPRASVITVLNKCDRLDANARAKLALENAGAALVSARTGHGVDDLIARIAAALPEGPFLYPADDAAAQPVRFFAAELVRETALEQLDEEVPYSVACEIEEFREEPKPVYIRAVIYVERDSQKAIVIGEKGARIRAIGVTARAKIETLIDEKVYLDLWVKVLPNWRRDPAALRRFGYASSEE